MAAPPRPFRPLPGRPAPDTEEGARASLVARTIIVITIVFGQLWALTVALEAYLLGHARQAWLLAAFSVASFALALALVTIGPRRGSGRGTAPPDRGGDRTYRADPARGGPPRR